MGGFAALVLGMKHPGMYRFVGAMSPPVDYPERGFAVKRWGQWMAIRSIFGPEGSAARRANDPFVLVRAADPARVPFVFLSVGSEEPLLGVVRRFDGVLTERRDWLEDVDQLLVGPSWQQPRGNRVAEFLPIV